VKRVRPLLQPASAFRAAPPASSPRDPDNESASRVCSASSREPDTEDLGCDAIVGVETPKGHLAVAFSGTGEAGSVTEGFVGPVGSAQAIEFLVNSTGPRTARIEYSVVRA